jgi:hypothetical protein
MKLIIVQLLIFGIFYYHHYCYDVFSDDQPS